MISLRFYASLAGVVLALFLLAVGISFLMSWLESRKRERAFVVRHRVRELAAMDAHRRSLEELALETEKRRAELRDRAGARP